MESFDVSLEYRYYQDIARRMARCCKLGRDIDANEVYYYMHLHYVKSFKDACIACMKDNRKWIICFKIAKSWFLNIINILKSLKQNKDVVF